MQLVRPRQGKRHLSSATDITGWPQVTRSRATVRGYVPEERRNFPPKLYPCLEKPRGGAASRPATRAPPGPKHMVV